MNKRWFTSDLHFGDPRIDLYERDLIGKNSDEIDELLIKNYNKFIDDKDIVYFIGDVVYDITKIELLTQLNGYKILIKGNYDDKIPDEILLKYFKQIHKELVITLNNEYVFLNHYPEKCSDTLFNICGHVHGAWKTQRNMVNVGVDAWHMCPVSEEKLLLKINSVRKYYDKNIFAGEMNCNLKFK